MTEPTSNDRRGRGAAGHLLTFALAGLGAVLLVGESANHFMRGLIGEDAPDVAEESAAPARAHQEPGFVSRQMAVVLRAANLPSHSEIERLSKQVDTLNRKVDQINRTGV